jgi:hypothetical protein
MKRNPGQADITPLVGKWVNSNPTTEWIKAFTLAEKDGIYTLHAFGVNEPVDWGETEVWAYQDNIGEMAFYAVYDLGFLESILAANSNKGLIVVAAFLRFREGGEWKNFLCREFYVRQQGRRAVEE